MQKEISEGSTIEWGRILYNGVYSALSDFKSTGVEFHTLESPVLNYDEMNSLLHMWMTRDNREAVK